MKAVHKLSSRSKAVFTNPVVKKLVHRYENEQDNKKAIALHIELEDYLRRNLSKYEKTEFGKFYTSLPYPNENLLSESYIFEGDYYLSLVSGGLWMTVKITNNSITAELDLQVSEPCSEAQFFRNAVTHAERFSY